MFIARGWIQPSFFNEIWEESRKCYRKKCQLFFFQHLSGSTEIYSRKTLPCHLSPLPLLYLWPQMVRNWLARRQLVAWVLQRNRTNRMYVRVVRDNRDRINISIYQDIYFKELAYTVVGSGKSKICRQIWLASQTSRKELQLEESRVSLQAEFLLAQRRSVFFLRPSTDWLGHIHITEDYLLYTKCADLNVNFIKV